MCLVRHNCRQDPLLASWSQLLTIENINRPSWLHLLNHLEMLGHSSGFGLHGCKRLLEHKTFSQRGEKKNNSDGLIKFGHLCSTVIWYWLVVLIISLSNQNFFFRHEESFPPIILGWEKGILGTRWVKRIQLMCYYDTILVLIVNCTLLGRNWTLIAIKLCAKWPPHCLIIAHREVQILPAVTTKTAPTWVTKSNSSIFLK